MLAACITERAGRMRHPLNSASPVPRAAKRWKRRSFNSANRSYTAYPTPMCWRSTDLRSPKSIRAPDIARILDKAGREANHLALGAWLAKAQVHGPVGAGNPAAMATQFLATLGAGC
jgi:hypothetical protein